MIDIHVHLHPPRLFAAIRKWFREKSDWRLYHATEPAAVCQVLKENGVSRFAFCSYAHKPAIARDLNEWLIQASNSIDRFGLPLATAHPDDADVLDYVESAFENGCIGLKIHEDVQRFGIDDRRLSSVYEVIAKNNGFVLAHVGPVPWDNDPKNAPDRVAAALRNNPGVNFVIAHMGAPDTQRYFDLMSELPNLYIDTTMAMALQFKAHTRVDRQSIEEHSERILFGTDFPNIPYAYDYEATLLRRLGLSEETSRRLFHDNAARLMRL